MSYDQAAAELPQINARLSGAATRYSAAYEEAKTALGRCLAIVAQEGAEVVRLRSRATELRSIVDRGPGERRVIGTGLREDPSLTPGLRAKAEESGETVITHQTVALNWAELIGALARVTGVSEEQKLAAAQLRMTWEQAQIGGARALDYEQVRVDTSGAGEDYTEVIGASARKSYAELTGELGMLRFSVLERVIIHDASLRDIAQSLGGDSGAAKRRARLVLFDALNHLVDLVGVRPGAGARRRHRRWNDGSDMHFTGDISTRR